MTSLWNYFFVVLMALSLWRARRHDDLPRLRWAGFTALFHGSELALVPWAFGWLAFTLTRLRFDAAASGADPLLSKAAANAFAPHATVIAFYATGILVLVGLPAYLRFTSAEEPCNPSSNATAERTDPSGGGPSPADPPSDFSPAEVRRGVEP